MESPHLFAFPLAPIWTSPFHSRPSLKSPSITPEFGPQSSLVENTMEKLSEAWPPEAHKYQTPLTNLKKTCYFTKKNILESRWELRV